jgi:hypothetical protein
LREARLLIDANRIALLTRVFLGIKILCISAAKDVKTVTMVGSNNDESILKLTELFETRDRRFDGVVQLKELTKSTIVVESVHHLVDRRCLGHDEPASIIVSRSTGLKDINGLQSHIFEARLIIGVTTAAVRSVLVTFDVLCIDVAIQPVIY